MADKPKVAIYWLTACGGCDEAIVDLNEAILVVADAIDIVLWPVAMDFKYESIRKMKKGEIGPRAGKGIYDYRGKKGDLLFRKRLREMIELLRSMELPSRPRSRKTVLQSAVRPSTRSGRTAK